MKYKKDIEGFRKYLIGEERSENTIACYITGVNLYFQTHKDLTKENVLEFKAELMENHKPKTVNNRLTALMAYAKYCRIDIGVKMIKVGRTLSVENIITEGEVKILLSKLKRDKNTRGYWMVRYLAETGARVSEFVRLTKGALERGYEELHTKGKVRRIYMSQLLVNESRKYFDKVEGDYLFPSRISGGALTPRAVVDRLHLMGQRYGIRKEVMHPHGFRHFCAKRLLANGAPITLVQEVLGHENLNTTALYTRGSTDEIQSQISMFLSPNNNANKASTYGAGRMG